MFSRIVQCSTRPEISRLWVTTAPTNVLAKELFIVELLKELPSRDRLIHGVREDPLQRSLPTKMGQSSVNLPAKLLPIEDHLIPGARPMLLPTTPTKTPSTQLIEYLHIFKARYLLVPILPIQPVLIPPQLQLQSQVLVLELPKTAHQMQISSQLNLLGAHETYSQMLLRQSLPLRIFCPL